MRIAIRGGRLIDPAHGIDALLDLFIAGGRIIGIGPAPDGFAANREIDARDRIVCPGLIDLCARLREPGQEHKATIASETRAAAAAGITTLVCPPDTDPVIDEPAVVEFIRRRVKAAGQSRVLTLGALTHRLRGERLAEMAALKDAGCVGVSDGGRPLVNTLVLRRALEYAATFDLTVFLTPLDPWLSHGVAHEGQVATRMGLAGIPAAAETGAIARDLELVRDIGVRVHFGRLSNARAVQLVARAQAEGLPVTADVAVHHLHLTEMDLAGFDSQCHVQPPLRGLRDKDALQAGLASGALGALCSDHQPHEPDAKQAPFGDTEPGISGLDTLLALSLRLARDEVLKLPVVLERLTWGPAQILGLDSGHLGIGAVADVCIFDPETDWRVTTDTLRSRGQNSPFIGWELQGQIVYTLLEGRVVYERTTP
ncbi:MAG: dihydroorotase [Candidatus Competibacteraceae bacterium]|uniref:Dihydroorotase-like protein n=1 Tax=Candidatus Contendobacter odensis Run_B_J11 TaxID=1400861 RepID=A0A7U7J2E0_9GAMM|nr:dihydroorotase [Candidatus Contendobacter odensis]MBK8535703.1 dihydroorotase [Candidatus Competibacteraceae bacterium]MBK8755238.1 dihydroorotase [Candidatus Competibacteraceae bacterium]CDH44050.1 Dihydroorotase-like protein [Candidatus Contendobacter odensis Run_B_J11]